MTESSLKRNEGEILPSAKKAKLETYIELTGSALIDGRSLISVSGKQNVQLRKKQAEESVYLDRI
jgi:hypothetical protein